MCFSAEPTYEWSSCYLLMGIGFSTRSLGKLFHYFYSKMKITYYCRLSNWEF